MASRTCGRSVPGSVGGRVMKTNGCIVNSFFLWAICDLKHSFVENLQVNLTDELINKEKVSYLGT